MYRDLEPEYLVRQQGVPSRLLQAYVAAHGGDAQELTEMGRDDYRDCVVVAGIAVEDDGGVFHRDTIISKRQLECRRI